MNSIIIAGIGPGAIDMVTPAALEVIRSCDVLIAGKRNLKTFEYMGKEVLQFDSGVKELLDKVELLRVNKKFALLFREILAFTVCWMPF